MIRRGSGVSTMWPFIKPKPVRALTGVGTILTARHIPPHRTGEPHSHDWEIVAWFPDSGSDALTKQWVLTDLVKPHIGTILPHEMSRAEGLARWVWQNLDGCVLVEVSRPSVHLFARYPG